jgi:hypothetical protein
MEFGFGENSRIVLAQFVRSGESVYRLQGFLTMKHGKGMKVFLGKLSSWSLSNQELKNPGTREWAGV